MRIISGKYKGRRILIPKKLPVRPTTNRAKEGIFNILENRYSLEEKSILDLFSGTGNIAFEFASRGCKQVTSVDKDRKCVRHINSFQNKLNINIEIVHSDCYKFIKECKNKYDLIFADPPYDYLQYEELKNLIIKQNIINKGGCVIFEHSKKTEFNDPNAEIRKYSNVYFSIFTF